MLACACWLNAVLVVAGFLAATAVFLAWRMRRVRARQARTGEEAPWTG